MIWEKVRSKPKGSLICAAALIFLVICMIGWQDTKGMKQTVMNETEARLAETLASIEGIGRVEVMISQKEQKSSFTFVEDQDSGQAQGVVVCAEGAEDFGVYCKLQRAVATLLDLSADCIEIYPLKTKNGR